MRNGDESIKRAAKLVTEKSNDDDGLARIIEQYVLCENPPLIFKE
jgi:hydroxymethylpyrimidine pyrophosphatase-like HAD family hydrolase